MSWTPQVRAWPSDRAVLFVHGVGDASPGSYDDLVRTFRKCIADEDASRYATYFLYYDDINDWMSRKFRFANVLGNLEKELRRRFKRAVNGAPLAEVAAEFGGDVLFPVLLESARRPTMLRYLSQVNQMRKDARTAGVHRFNIRISIVCHSLGCFHTFEALHAMANDPQQLLSPTINRMIFDNVVFMASPVQLIRTVADKLGGIVPGELATQSAAGLTFPGDHDTNGNWVSSSRNWVSITGSHDPVGGHLLEKKMDWAYMDIPGTDHLIVQPQALTSASVTKEIRDGLSTGATPRLSVNNPHSWESYIEGHAGELRGWFA